MARDTEEANFEPGQIVKLRSGGPDMTVLELLHTEVRCVWWEPTSASFKYVTLYQEGLMNA